MVALCAPWLAWSGGGWKIFDGTVKILVSGQGEVGKILREQDKCWAGGGWTNFYGGVKVQDRGNLVKF